MGVLKVGDGTQWNWASMLTGAIFCTSTTRPASPFQGMIIYETDTTRMMMWDGDSWENIAHLGAWQTYGVAWQADTTEPILGNGSITGRYVQHGKTVMFILVLSIGSTTNIGLGQYTLGLPVVCRNLDECIVSGIGSAPIRSYTGRGTGAGGLVAIYHVDTNNRVNAGNCGWVSGTTVRITGTYEAA